MPNGRKTERRGGPQVLNVIHRNSTGQYHVVAHHPIPSPSRCLRFHPRLRVTNNSKLRSLADLGSLTTIGGALIIEDNPSLPSLEGLDALAHVGGDGSISRNGALASLDGLGNLVQVAGTFTIEANPALERIDALRALSQIGPKFIIQSNSQLASLDGLEGLQKLVSVDEVLIWDCPKLINLRALSSLKSVNNGCNLSGDVKLPTCEAQWLWRLVEGLGASCTLSDTDDRGVCQ